MNTCVAHFTWAWLQEQGKAAHCDRVIPCESICFIYLSYYSMSKHVKVEVYRITLLWIIICFPLPLHFSFLHWMFTFQFLFWFDHFPFHEFSFLFYKLISTSDFPFIYFSYPFLMVAVVAKNWKRPLRISQPLCSKKKHGIFTINNVYVLMQRPERMMRHTYGV